MVSRGKVVIELITTPQQWAMDRVNSFVTKSSGTWGGADKDLDKKVRSSK